MNTDNLKNQTPADAKPVLGAVDLSWMWHCSDDPKNVLDYSELVQDQKIAAALTKAAATGFRLALRRLEDMELIAMGDIDRNPKHSDQEKWDEQRFNCS